MPTEPDPDASTVPSLDKPLWSIKEAAAYLRLTDRSIRAMIDRRLLVVYRIGAKKGRVRIKPSDVLAYLETVRSGPRPEVARATPMPRKPEKTKTPIMDELLAKRAARRAKRQAGANQAGH